MSSTKKGVGPHPLPWPTSEKYDATLLSQGDDRNVVDKYRYMTVQAIREDLDKNAHQLEIAIENVTHDYNIGTIVRNANAFGVRKVHIIGRKQWNRRGAMVTDAYLQIIHHKTLDEFLKFVGDKTLICVDNVEGAIALSDVNLPGSCILVFGSESDGLSDDIRSVSSQTIYIEQLGSTRSVNVGVASGIVMYKWLQTNIL